MSDTVKTEGAKASEENKEITPATEKKETAKKATTVKTEGAKAYKFKSANKFLTCTALGVQFIDGKATTDNLEVAKALAKIDGVELIEE